MFTFSRRIRSESGLCIALALIVVFLSQHAAVIEHNFEFQEHDHDHGVVGDCKVYLLMQSLTTMAGSSFSCVNAIYTVHADVISVLLSITVIDVFGFNQPRAPPKKNLT